MGGGARARRLDRRRPGPPRRRSPGDTVAILAASAGDVAPLVQAVCSAAPQQPGAPPAHGPHQAGGERAQTIRASGARARCPGSSWYWSGVLRARAPAGAPTSCPSWKPRHDPPGSPRRTCFAEEEDAAPPAPSSGSTGEPALPDYHATSRPAPMRLLPGAPRSVAGPGCERRLLHHDMGMVGCLVIPMALDLRRPCPPGPVSSATPTPWPELISVHGATHHLLRRTSLYVVTGRRLARAPKVRRRPLAPALRPRLRGAGPSRRPSTP